MNAYIHFVNHSPFAPGHLVHCIVVGFPPYLTFVTFNYYSVNFNNFAGDFVLVLLNNQSINTVIVIL